MDNVSDPNVEPDFRCLPLGRGMGGMSKLSHMGHVEMNVGATPVSPAGNRDSGLGTYLMGSPIEQRSQGGPHYSTPSGGDATLHQLSDMIVQLGSQIGESIAATLASSGAMGGVGLTNTKHSDDTHSPHGSHTKSDDAANTHGEGTPISVVVHTDKEPVIFRGDGTDKFTVSEWVDLMKSYLKKQKCDVTSQIEVVMGRLMGKARDVVKIGLRSDPPLNHSPDVIYGILTRYFSHTSSCLPLQDFYSTLPSQRENPVDYWIRLNKAADIAEEGLKRQNRHAGDMGGEIAKMFVKHCPDSEFASVFKCKQIHEWSTAEIQKRIDEFQRERVSSVKVNVPRTNVSPLTCYELHTEVQNACDADTYNATSLSPPALSLAGVSSVSPSSALSLNQQLSLTPSPQAHLPYLTTFAQQQPPQTLSSLPQCQQPPLPHALQTGPQQSQQTDSAVMLTEMMSMLRELLAKTQSDVRRPAPRRGGGQGWNRGRSATICRVCNDTNHTTESHCRSNRLCFTCFGTGHAQRSCPTKPSAQNNVQGN